MRTAFFIFVYLICWSTSSNGETYKYLDNKGNPCFTDNIKNVPEKYKKNAVLLKEDDAKIIVEPPPQADKIDESLLPPKEETVIKTDNASDTAESKPQQAFPYRNVGIIFSVFLATFVPGIFINDRNIKRVFGAASVAAMLTLLVYISVFFASRHMQTLKKDALEMTESMKKKEAEKTKEIQDILQEPSKL